MMFGKVSKHQVVYNLLAAIKDLYVRVDRLEDCLAQEVIVTAYDIKYDTVSKMPHFDAMTDADVKNKLNFLIALRMPSAFVKINRLAIER